MRTISYRVCVYTRSLGSFKSNVRNKAAPERCITEGYIATELVTFYSRYLDNAPTFHNRPQRNPDGSKGAGTRVTLLYITIVINHNYIYSTKLGFSFVHHHLNNHCIKKKYKKK
jgi:hypothetical protein